VENGLYCKTIPKAKSALTEKVREYNLWFQAQFTAFKDSLLDLVAGDNDAFHAVAIRTYIEVVFLQMLKDSLFLFDTHFVQLMKVDSFVTGGPSATPKFNMESFKSLLYALAVNKKEVDVDLLLMLKEEVRYDVTNHYTTGLLKVSIFCFALQIFSMHDCTYAALASLHEIINEVKDAQQQAQQRAQLAGTGAATSDPITANFDTIRKKFIDLLRVIELPDEIDEDNVLVPLVKPAKGTDADDGSDNENADGESSDEEREQSAKQERQQAALQHMDPLLAELAGLKGKKRGAGNSGGNGHGKRARAALTLFDRLSDPMQYKRAFSKAWLGLLALPFTPAQHKLLLKHLPEHVVPHLRNPMLLADYLTSSYATGGMVAVLALESLFHLIVHHNLDYPGFFLSLYNLCTVDVFSAKYRAKFMKLLSTSLKSVNLPAYLVAAFAKRLAHLALHTPTPNAQFCIAQCTWLLRQHPQAQVLIHRKARTGPSKDFDNNENTDLEKAHALDSSLWEMELLQQHHLYAAAQLAASLATPESTMVTAAAGAAYVHVADYLNIGYADLMDNALALSAPKKDATGEVIAGSGASGKREAALAYVRPTSLFEEGSTMRACFGAV
jgi:hypothetical protein